MPEAGKTFFVTGATGYLGSRLVRALVAGGSNVYCLRRAHSRVERLEDIEASIAWVDAVGVDFEAFFAGNPVDAVVHCATSYGRRAVGPLDTIEANLLLPLKLLHAAAAAGVPALLNTDTVLDKGVSNYALSKAQFVDWLKAYSTKLTCLNVALQHFYGAGDDPTKFTTTVVQSLLRGESRLKLTAGEQTRDFIHVDDVVSAMLVVLGAAQGLGRGYFHYEVGTGAPIRIRDFVTLAAELADNRSTALDFGALPYRRGEVMDIRTELGPLLALGWSPRIGLREGLTQMIESEKALLKSCDT